MLVTLDAHSLPTFYFRKACFQITKNVRYPWPNITAMATVTATECSRCRQASPRECSCNPMHVSPIVRAVHVRARAREPVSKRSL